MDDLSYHWIIECGCVHYFYRGTDFYAHTVVCPKHREMIGYVPRKRQPIGDGTELEPQRG